MACGSSEMEQPGMGDCSSTNCCAPGIPDATKPDGAGPVSAARNTDAVVVEVPDVADWELRYALLTLAAELEDRTGRNVRLLFRKGTLRVASCRNCGNDPQAITRAFKAGVQAAYWDTYADNLAATAARELAEAERLNHWRYGE